jgi:hypothetical protein
MLVVLALLLGATGFIRNDIDLRVPPPGAGVIDLDRIHGRARVVDSTRFSVS